MNTEQIKIAIYKKKETQKEIAEKIGINPQTLTYWINDQNTKNIKNFLKLMQYLDLSIDDLLKKDDDY